MVAVFWTNLRRSSVMTSSLRSYRHSAHDAGAATTPNIPDAKDNVQRERRKET